MSDPDTAGVDWTGGSPRSTRYGDIYFSPEDGLAESRAVFLDGLDLPAGWKGRSRFTLGELGFGTGLNVLALLQRWASARPSPQARLNVFSVEAHPLTRSDAGRALAAWPELAPWVGPLLAQWPSGRRGMHRVAWPDAGATLDLAVGEAEPALGAWSGAADAWVLDGFSPAVNPAMWTPALMALVVARSAPGARVATFTVARGVRQALADAGFTVEKRPGHGRKRERLEGRRPGVAPASSATPTAVVIGAGIAGAALVHALAREGCAVTVIERERAGAGASGAPAALVTPRLDAGFGPAAVLHAQALERARDLYDTETPQAVVARGAVQLEAAPRDAGRFDRIAAWDGFAPGTMQRLDPLAAASALGEATAPAALAMAQARVVEPAVLLDTWLAPARRIVADVASLEARQGGGWRVLDPAGATLAEADVVVLAAGPETARLAPLPLEPVRGQLSTVTGVALGGEPAAWGGYAIPLRDGILFGATHGRGDADGRVRGKDAARNLAALAAVRPVLAARIASAPPSARGERAAVRAATPDRSPLAGAVAGAEGLFVLSGLGGRGFTLAPLLAEHVAALVVGAPSPLSRGCAALVDPARYTAAGTPRTAAPFPATPPEDAPPETDA